ncbi:MAG TPA: MFS transporter [Microbacterium sp.]|nr:MFS transporter [Microbacterium sp.]
MRKEDASNRTTPGTPDAGTMSKRAAASGFFGSVLEYYDFSVYASAATIVFPQVFFPSTNPTVALVASLATYGVGYVARPIGAFVLGSFGDRLGRKRVLVFALMLMGISTFLVGVLPTYAQVGVLAPALLVVLRLIQGFAVSGELGGASAMIAEHAPNGRRGFYTSFSLQGTQAGSILASAIFIPLAAALPAPVFESWGWRVPFLLSAVVVIGALIVRSRVAETPAFLAEAARSEAPKVAAVEVFRLSAGTVLRAVLMGLANVLGTTGIVFATAYATQPAYGVSMDKATFLWIPVTANIVAVILIPFFGRLSDRIGRKPMMVWGPIAGGVLSFGYLLAIKAGNLPLTFLLAILMVGVLFQLWNATFASFFQELFPTRVRVTGFAVSQNIALLLTAFLPSLFALAAPPGSTTVPFVIGGLTLLISLISAVAAWTAPETVRRDITADALGSATTAPAN